MSFSIGSFINLHEEDFSYYLFLESSSRNESYERILSF